MTQRRKWLRPQWLTRVNIRCLSLEKTAVFTDCRTRLLNWMLQSRKTVFFFFCIMRC